MRHNTVNLKPHEATFIQINWGMDKHEHMLEEENKVFDFFQHSFRQTHTDARITDIITEIQAPW